MKKSRCVQLFFKAKFWLILGTRKSEIKIQASYTSLIMTREMMCFFNEMLAIQTYMVIMNYHIVVNFTKEKIEKIAT